jgi:endogenous inhibitor of DNA gyrase (YacG/DUF329 family)
MKVKCPTCQAEVIWNEQAIHRPFCSKRCQLIDLGQWANEEHTIASDENKLDKLPDNIDIEDIEAMLAQQSNDNDGFFKT